MPTTKRYDAYFYHPTVSGYNGTVADLFADISNLPATDRTVTSSGDKLILNLERRGPLWILTLQKLKSDDLPKIADESDGRNEQDFPLPPDKSLSYKNTFVFYSSKNLLVAAKIHAHPTTTQLSYCIRKIVATSSLGNDETFSLRFGQIFERGLIEKLRTARTITHAEFTAIGDYYGDNIDERRLDNYRPYLAGRDFVKTTKIKGLHRGDNIKNIIRPIIEDYVSNCSMLEGFNIKMTIDGESVNFQRYFKKTTIEIPMVNNSKKHVDYASLEHKLEEIAAGFEVSS